MSFNGMDYAPQLLNDIIEWDVANWSRALRLWDSVIPENTADRQALDLGARNGGLSLYLALKGYHVICSDVDVPGRVARSLHDEYHVSERVVYEAINMVEINLPSNTLDLVAFKSVLPSVGSDGATSKQMQGIREVLRVLKPGGLLLFAENLTATPVHMYFRRRFTGWGRTCGYLTLNVLDELLSLFSEHVYSTFGFFAALGRSEGQRRWLHGVDVIVNPMVPASGRYLVYGYAVK